MPHPIQLIHDHTQTTLLMIEFYLEKGTYSRNAEEEIEKARNSLHEASQHLLLAEGHDEFDNR